MQINESEYQLTSSGRNLINSKHIIGILDNTVKPETRALKEVFIKPFSVISYNNIYRTLQTQFPNTQKVITFWILSDWVMQVDNIRDYIL